MIVINANGLYGITEKGDVNGEIKEMECKNVYDRSYKISIDGGSEINISKDKFEEKYEVIEERGSTKSKNLFGGMYIP